MANQKARLGTIASIASIIGIPLAIVLWHFGTPANTPDASPTTTTLSSKGDASPVLNAGRDAVLSSANDPKSNQHRAAELPNEVNSNSLRNGGTSTDLSSTGSNSPVVNAGRDAIVNLSPPMPDFVSHHDGAGALLMTEPNFDAFVDSALRGKGEKVIGRLVNGTALSKLELREGNSDEPNPPWVKVKVLEGDYRNKEGWILMSSIRNPR